MKTPTPVISKDLVTELRKLSASAAADSAAYDKARTTYLKAADRSASSTTEFAVALYEFAQKFAPFPGVVDPKLAELKLSYASQSVYYRIARLAFEGSNEDVRMSVSRYGKVIEQAAKAKYSVDDFRKEVDRGLEAFRTKLGIAVQPKLDLIDLGRKKASQLLQNKTYPIKGLAGDLNLPDGEEVGLIAKIENGELVVYGLLPSQVGATSGALRKLGAPEVATQSLQLSLWKDMLRTLKLVTSSSDEKSLATYSVTKDAATFSVAGSGAYAVLVFPSAGDFLKGKSITLSVADWVRICTTLSPMGRLIETLTFDGRQVVATVDESKVPDLGKWFEDSGKPSRIGQLNGPSLVIDLKSLKATKAVWADAKWSGATEVDVRRQMIWLRLRVRVAECLARRGVDVMRRSCGAASGDVRWSVA